MPPNTRSRAMMSRKARSSTGTCSPKSYIEEAKDQPTGRPPKIPLLEFNRDSPPKPVLSHCATQPTELNKEFTVKVVDAVDLSPSHEIEEYE